MTTAIDTREAWLAERRTGIGSSDAASCCGGNLGFGSPLHVYMDKLGLLPPFDNAPMRWGRLLEDVVAEAWKEETGLGCVGTPGLVRHRTLPWMLATPDRIAADGPLECKTSGTGEGWGPSGTDTIPLGYVIQVAHQMAVLDLPRAHVAVLIRGTDFRWYVIERDPVLEERLLGIERSLWDRVQAKEPPEPDWTHPDTPALLARLHVPDPDRTVELDEVAETKADEYADLGVRIAALASLRDIAKAELLHAMGTASTGLFPSGGKVTRKMVTRKAHSVAESKYPDFRISGRKKPVAE